MRFVLTSQIRRANVAVKLKTLRKLRPQSERYGDINKSHFEHAIKLNGL